MYVAHSVLVYNYLWELRRVDMYEIYVHWIDNQSIMIKICICIILSVHWRKVYLVLSNCCLILLFIVHLNYKHHVYLKLPNP